MASATSSLDGKPRSSLNEQQIALRLGWSVAELVGRLTALNRKRSGPGDTDRAAPQPGDGGSSLKPPTAGASSPRPSPHPGLPPKYKVGRTLTLSDEKDSDSAGPSDSLKLWFLARTVVRLGTQIGTSAKESLDPILPQLRDFPREPSHHNWRVLFHAVESLNREVMIELAARDPLSAKAYGAGKLLAQLFWSSPSAEEVKKRIRQAGRIDAYTLLPALETSRMAELIRDLREIQDHLLEGTFPALAAGISAWEIQGLLERDGGRLKLRQRPRLTGLRLAIVHLPLLRRVFRHGLLSRLRPRYPRRLKNVKLSPAEASMIGQNLRDQSSIWRDLVFETRGPNRLLKPSDWYRINFTSSATLWLGALVVVTSLAGLGLGLAFFAGPGIFDLARVAYGDEKFEGLQIFRSLTAAPLLTLAGGILSRFRNVVGAVRETRHWVRTRLIGNAIRRQAVRKWNRLLPEGQRRKFAA